MGPAPTVLSGSTDPAAEQQLVRFSRSPIAKPAVNRIEIVRPGPSRGAAKPEKPTIDLGRNGRASLQYRYALIQPKSDRHSLSTRHVPDFKKQLEQADPDHKDPGTEDRDGEDGYDHSHVSPYVLSVAWLSPSRRRANWTPPIADPSDKSDGPCRTSCSPLVTRVTTSRASSVESRGRAHR